MSTASSAPEYPLRRRQRRRAWALALCTAVSGAIAQAEPARTPLTPLTLDAAVILAQARSRQLDGHDAAAQAARELAVAAGQRPDLVLKTGINNLPVDGADRFSLTRDFMTMRSIGVMQEFTRRDKLAARSARFNLEAERAEAARLATLTDLRRETAKAWLDRHYQERVRQILATQRNEASLQVEAADAAYRSGGGSQADLFSARLAVARIDDRIRQADRQILTATTRLARWIGEDASRELAAAPAMATVRLDAQSLETRMARHPQLELMLKQEQVALSEADVARSNRRPDWSIEFMYNQRGSAFSNMVSVNFTIPLQLDPGNRQDRELAAKLATAEQMRAEREETVRAEMAVIHGWLQQWQSNRDRLSHYDHALTPLAAERTRAAIAAYRGGTAPLDAVLEARRIEIDTLLERVGLEMETAGLWAQLNYLIPAGHEADAPVSPATLPTR